MLAFAQPCAQDLKSTVGSIASQDPGKSWLIMAKHRKTWQNMVKHGKTWQIMANHGKTWQNKYLWGTRQNFTRLFPLGKTAVLTVL